MSTKTTDHTIDFEKLKRKHKRVIRVSIDRPTGNDVDDGKGNSIPEIESIDFAFRAPDRRVLAAAAKFGTTDPIKSTEVLVDSLLIEGPRELLDEDIQVWLAVGEQLQKSIEPYSGRLKNY